MISAGTRALAWMRRHVWLSVASLVALVVLLSWGGYRGGRYLWARSHYQAAQQALDRQEWVEARTHLDACLEVWPDSPDVHLQSARVARRMELLDQAVLHLTTCQELLGEETQAIRVERALLRIHRGDLAGVEQFLRDSIAQNDPATVEILDILSAALILNHRVAEAHRCLDDLLQRQPDHFHALVRRGGTAQSMGWYELAVESLGKALALRPEVDSVRLPLAEFQVVLGRYAEARTHFELLRKRQPYNPAVLFGLARSQAGMGEKEQALQLFNQLMAMNPQDWQSLGERGWLYVQLDRPREGEADLRRAAALAPLDLPIKTRFAECLRLLGKTEEARKYQEQAERLQADFQRAANLGDLIREKSPDDPALRHELGSILLRTGKRDDAVHWFRTALDKDPKHRPTHEALAAFYEKHGAPEQAAHHRRILKELGSANPDGSPQ